MTYRVPAGRVPLALLRRIDLRRLFVGDLALKSAAIAVALLLWVSTMVRSAPPAEETLQFDGRIPVERPEVPAGYVLRGQLGDVSVGLRGPQDAVRSIGQQQLRATLDISGIAPGPELQEAPVRVAVADGRVRIVGVAPPSVAVRLERRTERVLAVQSRLANDPPAGYQPGPATFRPPEVTVSGPESVVGTVAAVLATVRFGDAPVDLAQTVQPEPVDASGQRVQGVDVDPVAVQVSVPVLSTATTRTVPVLWQLRGAVAPGYWISRVAAEPVAVTVSGERQIVTALDRIDTAAVDVTGLTAGRTFVASLMLPSGVSIVGPTRAAVTVTVVALVGTRPFPLVAVQAADLGPDLSAELDPRTVDVVLAGTVPVLNGLGADAVGATVELARRAPGTYSLDVAIRAPAGTTVQSLQPARVTVTIRSTKAPTQ